LRLMQRLSFVFLYCARDHPYLLSFPTRRSSDLLSTHLIDEVSLLFEEVLILREGELIVHETADELRTRACRITGDVDQVNAFIEGKQVLEEKQIGHLKTVTLLGRRSEAEAAGFEPKGVAIQDLMIYLTEKEGA